MKVKKILRYFLLFLCYSNLAWFLFITIVYVFLDFTFIGQIVTLIYPAIAPFLCLIYIVSGIIIIRFSFMKNRKGALTVIGICIFILIFAFMPYISIPFGISAADNQMVQTYGVAYTNLDTSSMRPTPYSIFDNFFGFPIDESQFSVQTDILYLNNGNDSFYFDWYKPNGPGPFPVIIALHGGGWVIGNKGPGNVIPFNKYFASKGYVVFDIQYGVYDISALGGEMGGFGEAFSLIRDLITPAYNESYTIEQQVENIGYFTKMLELNSTKYHADLNNTFVVGRSAGAHMASVVTLGYKNPLFTGNFSATMNITGGIWFYPPTNLSKIGASFTDTLLAGSLPLAEQYDKFSASFLIDNSTVVPPIMIVHGTKDKMVDYPTQGVEFYEYAKGLGKKCVLITIPWAGHGFDINFQTFGGQISTYYIERFMALELLSGG
ncbi:MAG: alpha/beta hydrolase [Candidatus Helarchaeota archaeon]|nr:alpha/beta hydrolase [Candidatus Helarchaeota archaeon]